MAQVDLLGSVTPGLQLGSRVRGGLEQRKQQALLGGLRRQSLGIGGETQQEQQQARTRLLGQSPAAFQELQSQQRTISDEGLRSVGIGAREALAFTDAPSQDAFLQDRRAKILARGGDTTETDEALALPFEQRQQVLKGAVDIANRAGVLKVPTAAGLATKKAFEGDLTFRDEEGNIFSQQTFADPNTREATGKLTDITGRGISPVGKVTPITKTGESEQEKRRLDVEAASQKQQKIEDIKTSTAAGQEREKLLGKERADISQNIRKNATVARRSKSQVLRVQRALKAAATGRLAVARDLIGNLIPGIKDVDAEVFQSLATQFALDELSKQSGTKTDFDFQKAAETQARLGSSPEANEAILQIALDRMSELEEEENQFRKFKKGGGNAEDFVFEPPSIDEDVNGGDEPKTITTQKQFDALPSGAQFIEDGKLRTKK